MNTNYILIIAMLVLVLSAMGCSGGEVKWYNPFSWKGPAESESTPPNHVRKSLGSISWLGLIGVGIGAGIMFLGNPKMGLAVFLGSLTSLAVCLSAKVLLDSLWILQWTLIATLILSIGALIYSLATPGGLELKKKFPFIGLESPSS